LYAASTNRYREQVFIFHIFCAQELDEKQQQLDRVTTKLQTLEEV
jgi:hypothetical protein